MVREAEAAYNHTVQIPASPWPRRALIALLLGPSLALAFLVGERTLRDAGFLPEEPGAYAEVEVELQRGPGRLVLFSATSPELEVFDLAGARLGQLATFPSTTTQGLPLRDGDWVLYLGTAHEAQLGQIPERGERYTERFRLPDDARLVRSGDHARELPRALRCGDAILLELERGWARLALGPGRRYRRDDPPPFAPRAEGDPPAGCRALRPVESRQLLPVEHALFAELWLEGRPHVLGAPRLPPPYLVLVGPDRQRLRTLRPPFGLAVSTSALRSGRHLLFHGNACDLGELRLTYADLEDPWQRPQRWSTVIPIRQDGCRPGAFSAELCVGGSEPAIRATAGARRLALRLSDGGRIPDPGGRCEPLSELRRDAAPWEAARTLEVGRWRYRLEPGKEGLELHAQEAGRPRWSVLLDATGYLLGATDDALLLVAGDRLVARERANGARRLERVLPALQLEPRGLPPRCRYVGSHGRRGYFLVQGAVSRLLLFDGDRVLTIR